MKVGGGYWEKCRVSWRGIRDGIGINITICCAQIQNGGIIISLVK